MGLAVTRDRVTTSAWWRRRGWVYVQFWLRPGDPSMEVSVNDEARQQVMSEVLLRHL